VPIRATLWYRMLLFLKNLFFRIPATPRKGKQRFLLTDECFDRLQRALNYPVKDRQKFEEALVHRSYIQYIDDELYDSNERLEFLGDAVLGVVVAEHLFLELDANEGDLTKYRSRLVNRKALAEYAGHLHLQDFILVSPSAKQTITKGNDTILSDAYEAIIGAIYLDGGFDSARSFIHDFIITNPVAKELLFTDENHKSRLLEYSQSKNLGLPRYVVVNEKGPDHERIFTVEVFLRNALVGEGRGRSKRDAEQDAAGDALTKIGVKMGN
jgi:ribonuclease-3